MTPLDKWLKTQPKEFVENHLNNDMLGNGQFTINELRELDEYFNPEDEE